MIRFVFLRSVWSLGGSVETPIDLFSPLTCTFNTNARCEALVAQILLVDTISSLEIIRYDRVRVEMASGDVTLTACDSTLSGIARS